MRWIIANAEAQAQPSLSVTVTLVSDGEFSDEDLERLWDMFDRPVQLVVPI